MSSADRHSADVVIVGASISGVRVAQALRMQGHTGTITILGEEPHGPYDKPPLSKEMLHGASPPQADPLLTAEQLAELAVDLRLGTRATALDTHRQVVSARAAGLDFEVGYDQLVIATGVTPRTLPGSDDRAGIHTLRTFDDAVALRAQLRPGARAVVIGAGFIGAEFAAAARLHGMTVTIVEAQAVPLAHVLGPEVGAILAGLHESNGVAVLAGRRFSHFVGDGHVNAVVLEDGAKLDADVVVVGIGVRPATDWLIGSGLPIDDGVDCDENLRVLGHDNIYAVGDVARWLHPLYNERLRIEHWTNAQDHASVVAACLTGKELPRPTLPYVWSDQYGRRIQIIGRPSAGVAGIVRGDVTTGDLLALFADPQGVMVGALVLDDPRLLMKCRKAILGGTELAAFEQELLAVS